MKFPTVKYPGTVIRKKGFPWVAPTWPETISRELKKENLGANYDTEWARKPFVRASRSALIDFVARPLARAIAPTDIEGLDRLETLETPAIFAANHSSHLDTTLILSVLPERFRHRAVVGAGADYFFDKRWKAAWWAFSIGAIPIERTKVTRKSAAQLEQLINDNYSVVIFPEGGRTPDGWMQEFRAGAAYLSERTGVPVVPIYLGGTRSVWKKGSSRITPNRVSVTFGSPMSLIEGEDIRAFAARVEKAVAELADETNTDWWSAKRRAAENKTPQHRGPDASAWRRSWVRGENKRIEKPKRWPSW
jgi:1-acyl-sn-glycerol-3-phosphate acyltransferase